MNSLTLSTPFKFIARYFQTSAPANVFDSLPSLSAPRQEELRDELDRYLSTDPEAVEDVLKWWYGNRAMYPSLSRMALDYLTIPGAFVPPLPISVPAQTTPYQQLLLTSNVYSAVAALSYPMSVIDCQYNRLVPCYV